MTTLSIVIPTLNAEAYIEKLILRLNLITRGIKAEIIIIDSSSKDATKQLVEKLMGKYPLRFYLIKGKNFNHGTTRNLGVTLARGKYVCFLSQDALPMDSKTFDYFFEDLSNGRRVVAAFAKDTPGRLVPHFLKLEQICRYRHLDALSKGKPLFQSQKDLARYVQKINYYSLSNVFACYKKSFLTQYPFPRADFGEDLLLGKTLLEKGFIKVYDPRIKVIHYQKINLLSYYQRQKADLKLRLGKMKLEDSPQILCKLKTIFSERTPFSQKIYYLFEFGIYYLVKGLAFLNG